MTAVSLAAIEDDIKQFVLLVWSLVSSLLIDALFIGAYQIFVEPITSFSRSSRASCSIPRSVSGTSLSSSQYLCSSACCTLLPSSSIFRVSCGHHSGEYAGVVSSRRQPWENYLKHADQVMVKDQ